MSIIGNFYDYFLIKTKLAALDLAAVKVNV
jgi:hypothetical protein